MPAQVPPPHLESCSRTRHTGWRVASHLAFLSVAAGLMLVVGGRDASGAPSASPVGAGSQGAPAAPAPHAHAQAVLPAVKAPALRAVVTIAPLKSFVEPLLPEGSQLRVLMQPGKSEHGYEFTPSDLRALAEADVVVLVGLNLEPAVEKTLASREDPSRRVVRFSDVAGIKSDSDATHEDADHDETDDHADHEHGEDCDHGPIDPHLWLDPILCDQLVGAVRTAIDAELTERSALSEDAKAALDARQADLKAHIARVDQAWRAAAPSLVATPIVTHHNAFQRLADRYGLRVAAVIRGVATADPSPAQVASVARTIREQHVRTIYVEPQFDRKLADRIAKAAGVSVATLDPLGKGDWFALMDANLAALRENAAPADAAATPPAAPMPPTPGKPK